MKIEHRKFRKFKNPEILKRQVACIDVVQDLMLNVRYSDEYKNQWKNIAADLMKISIEQEDEFNRIISNDESVGMEYDNHTIGSRITNCGDRVDAIWLIPDINIDYKKRWAKAIEEIVEVVMDQADEFDNILK